MQRFYTIDENNKEQFNFDWLKEAVEEKSLITVNGVGGGKTSAYIASNYPADHTVFSLVRTTDKNCMFPDAKVRQMVSDRIGTEFIGTLEFDEIIYTILDLEQFIGKKIDWVTGKTFDEVVLRKNGKHGKCLPDVFRRFCTQEMKIKPLGQWAYDNLNEVHEWRLGFRANETRRAENTNKRLKNGCLWDKFIIGKHKNGNNKWTKEIPYQIPVYPLIEDNIYKDQIEAYWKGKPVRFAYMNNCVGCFHRPPALLNHISHKAPNKFKWFSDQEVPEHNILWKSEKGITYDSIGKLFKQLSIFDDDEFNECDSGYCGL